MRAIISFRQLNLNEVGKYRIAFEAAVWKTVKPLDSKKRAVSGKLLKDFLKNKDVLALKRK